MNRSHLLRSLIVWGVLTVFLVIPIQAVFGSSPINDLVVVSADTTQEVSPVVAYNSARNEYFVVWYNDRAGCDDIRAQRVSASGTLLGGPFYISAGCSLERRYPDVVYNSGHDQYLVVWEQYDPSAGYSIRGRRVSGNGTVLDASDISIQGSGYNFYTPTKPAVSYASTSDRYLVVWAETSHPMPITYFIYGKVINKSGVIEGNLIKITQASESLQEPDVAYNRHANRYLVVWQKDFGTLTDIYGQQLQGNGTLYQSAIQIAYYTVSSTAPAVASIPTSPIDDKFLVVWESHYAAGDHDIWGRPIAEDGTAGVRFSISDSAAVNETAPAIAATESNHSYFVVWNHPQGVIGKPIMGQAILYDGTKLGNTVTFSGVAADHSAVAAGSMGDLFTVWKDQPISATNTNIYGQLTGNRVYLPMLLRP